MSDYDKIRQESCRRGISRLCHFTPSRKLGHIISGQKGILATSHLEEYERDIFNPTDIQRYDGHKAHICCSVEYPNGWYFDRTRASEVLFKDWVILFINHSYLWKPGVLFCHRNAAANYGRFLKEGFEGFVAMYESEITGAYDMTIKRSSTHLSSCPTDNQAEVLIPDSIEISDIVGIAVENESQAVKELKRFELMNVKCDLPIYICPYFYDKRKLSQLISNGNKPIETEYNGI